MSIINHIKRLKDLPETAAVGNMWSREEETQLIDSLRQGKDIADIAQEHKRTVGGIKSRMKMIAIRMIEIDGKSVEEVCMKMHLKVEYIENAIQKKRTPKPTLETELEVLKDIRDMLVRIEAKLFNENYLKIKQL
jgi:serine phosphatase RsbU (regulator of sigma subunit)